ncbi:MAG: hypothetical protein K2O45_18365 [Oscillospiraceae bacterium]|nr:hypothetical protein [Oscillospiraceae bacterium]
MRDFFYRISSAMARFMYGRNGSDQLNMALLAAYLVLWVVQIFFGRVFAVRIALEAASVVLAAVVLFRCFSRNLAKRRAENARFLNWWRPVKNRLSGARQRRQDKDHKYFTCKTCKTICRVPAGKGKIEITCPKCGGKIIGKS